MAGNNFKHGHASPGHVSPTYACWDAMKKRCSKPNHTAFKYYGGRGITVCERWLEFTNFLEDMGEKPDGLTIERIDNERGYEPGNCKWATRKEQQHNTRTNVWLTSNGQTMIARDWSRLLGYKRKDQVATMLHLGYPFEHIIAMRIENMMREVGLDV